MAGSSPRMRGTQLCEEVAQASGGIIPAYAGNTLFDYYSAKRQRDHPRVCGEHELFKTMDAAGTGSSPRMRGTPVVPTTNPDADGIIPAYAGNTPNISMAIPFGRDHPRVCGEHLSADSIAGKNTGSSPRMRGTLWFVCSKYVSVGIIPAYAGNTSPWETYTIWQ